jgi:AAA ATPase domain
LIGREAELEALEEAIERIPEGVLWVPGRAGMGKSVLMARLAVDRLALAAENEKVLAYRFKVGNGRCSRAHFLCFACERLREWVLERQTSESGKKSKPPQDSVTDLRRLLERLQGKKVTFILDGLDEIAETDARFVHDFPLALKAPDVLWICSGRMEHGLPEAFASAVQVFPDGLPEMSDVDMGTLLLRGLGQKARQLARVGRDVGDRVVNDFIQRVVGHAKGLPLYVGYVIGDAGRGVYRAFDRADADKLPTGIEEYHEKQLQRCQVGILHQVLTPVVGTLAVSEEPLSVGAVHGLLAMRNVVDDSEGGLATVREAIGAVTAMLRRTVNVDGEDAYELWHHSLRTHLLASEGMRQVVSTARRRRGEMATWGSDRRRTLLVPAGNRAPGECEAAVRWPNPFVFRRPHPPAVGAGRHPHLRAHGPHFPGSRRATAAGWPASFLVGRWDHSTLERTRSARESDQKSHPMATRV